MVDASGALPWTNFEAWQMRKDLAALRSNDTAEDFGVLVIGLVPVR